MTERTATCPSLHDVVTTTLGDFKLTNMREKGDESANFSLVDLCSTPGKTIDSGREQIDLMAEDIVEAVLTAAPECAISAAMDALAPGKPADAALNLEGAIDTLLIANRMNENDTVIRTMRRVYGQIMQAQASIEIELARKMVATNI